tara:strand:+ start:1315 stop:1554 length:240 start_codon:yes stop_codon:yes gene_type:complete
MTNQELEQWAQSREVSFEIAKSIQDLCNDDYEKMDQVWEDPTPKQISDVMEMAWDLTDEDELYWGDTLDRKDFNNEEGK